MGTAIIFGSLASLIVFYAMNKSMKNRKSNNRQRFMENYTELITSLREKPNSNPSFERSDATKA